jgi:hypothetical protein
MRPSPWLLSAHSLLMASALPRPGGKGLGADIGLVGPGPSHERWKKAPGYQQWLAETRPMKSSEG